MGLMDMISGAARNIAASEFPAYGRALEEEAQTKATQDEADKVAAFYKANNMFQMADDTTPNQPITVDNHPYSDKIRAASLLTGVPAEQVMQVHDNHQARKYDDIVQKASAKFGVHPDLIHEVIKRESAYNPNAVSPTGPVGLMQMSRAASRAVGLPLDQRTNPEANIMGGTAYLKKMLDAVGPNKALLAYHDGLGGMHNPSQAGLKYQKFFQGIPATIADSGQIMSDTPQEAMQPDSPQQEAPQMAGDRALAQGVMSRSQMVRNLQLMGASGIPALQKIVAAAYPGMQEAQLREQAFTAEQKNLSDPVVAKYLRDKQAQVHAPSGSVVNGQGEIQFRPVAGTGENFNQMTQRQRQEVKDQITPLQQQQLDMSQTAQDRIEEERQWNRQIDTQKLNKSEESKLQQMAPNHRQAWTNNNFIINRIDDLTAKLQGNLREADRHVGLRYGINNKINQKIDPQGVQLRAEIQALSNAQILDTSGKAVSKTEDKRLEPNTPYLSDDARTIQNKLKVMRGIANDHKTAIEESYAGGGFKNLPWEATKDKAPSPNSAFEKEAVSRTGKRMGFRNGKWEYL